MSSIPESEDDRAIVRAVGQLGHALDLTIVAEGVENAQVRRSIDAHDLGIDRLQGWGIAPAMRVDELLEWFDTPAEAQYSRRAAP